MGKGQRDEIKRCRPGLYRDRRRFHNSLWPRQLIRALRDRVANWHSAFVCGHSPIDRWTFAAFSETT